MGALAGIENPPVGIGSRTDRYREGNIPDFAGLAALKHDAVELSG